MRPIDADKLIEDAELRYVKVGARSNGKSILAEEMEMSVRGVQYVVKDGLNELIRHI